MRGCGGAFPFAHESTARDRRALWSSRSGTLGGGGGGGIPSRFSSTQKPRRTGAVRSGIRGHHQDRALAKQAAAGAIGKRDLAESLAVDPAHAVVIGEPLIEERIVGANELEDAAIVAELAARERVTSPAETRIAGSRRTRERCWDRAACWLPSECRATGCQSCQRVLSIADRAACGAPAVRARPGP